ncbi:class I SAM-dependent methyltransferase [Streptomyces sp. NPDC000410]|uniref:class I SAM-dependent methyltransferase n=1 Tax=Streptomyces sp. NPDC000410 TaxID=3154254 RepID=UPI00331AFE7F
MADFESWDSAGREFDAVVSGEAWPWVDPVAGAAKAARVLRPGGRFAAFWNVGEPDPEVAEVFAAVYRELLPGSRALRRWTTGTDRYTSAAPRTADGMQKTGEFTEPEQWRFSWERFYTRDDWLEELPTTGGFSAAAERGNRTHRERHRHVGGAFRMYYTATVITAVRAGAASRGERRPS